MSQDIQKELNDAIAQVRRHRAVGKKLAQSLKDTTEKVEQTKNEELEHLKSTVKSLLDKEEKN